MKAIGILLIIVGIIGLLMALNMDTSIVTESQNFGYGVYIPEQRVNNLGLMNDKQNYIILSSISIILGTILFIAGNIKEKKENASDANALNQNLSPNNFPDYERDINLDKYKIYLQIKYSISKNETFEKFLFQDKLCDNLCDALMEAHIFDAKLENEQISKEHKFAALDSDTDAAFGKTIVIVMLVVLFMVFAFVIASPKS